GQLAVDAPDLPDRIWQLVRPQHDEGYEQDDHQLTTRHVEHAASLRSVRPAQMAPAKGSFGTVPDVQQRLPSLLDPPIAFAHRGARAHAPENTIRAFGLARRLGATGLESDVWLTSDGVPVLDHDGVVRVRLRSRPIGSVPRADLPEAIPSLVDLFEACG